MRIHVARVLGCPIVGDDLYWEDALRVRASGAVQQKTSLPAVRTKGGLYLQSCGVRFAHPVDGRTIEVLVPEQRKFASLREREAKRASLLASFRDGDS